MAAYDVKGALVDVVGLANSKFSESVDLVVVLDERMTKHGLRGVIDLPCGVGNEVKVGVFANGDDVKAAFSAGADVVGSVDLVQKILSDGKINCDWFISTPDLMPVVAQLSKILGPSGLMPNPKHGTVTSSFFDLISQIKRGRVRFKSDACGLIHIKIGDIKFNIDALEDNLIESLNVIQNLQSDRKCVVIKSAYVSTTMSNGSVKLKLN